MLSDLQIEEKASTLDPIFKNHLPVAEPNMPNDGILVKFINAKLAKKFGRVADRDNNSLTKSIEYVVVIIDELRSMLK
ncbi:hypothetical protein D9M71_717330 [compost metagenome]